MQKTNDNPALTLDADKKTYLYGTHLTCGCVPRFTAKLDRTVDSEILQQAADIALARFPQVAVGLAQDQKQYFLLPIDLPAPVFADTKTIRMMGTDDTNAYLFCVTHEGNTIHADWFHAIADGRGFLDFFQTILYHYLKLLDLPVENDGSIRDVQTEEADASRHPSVRVHAALAVGSPTNTVVQIRLPLDQLRGAEENDKENPDAFMGLMFSAAIHGRCDAKEHTSAQEAHPITNLGKISLPPAMEAYVEELYVCMGAAIDPFTLAAVSYKGELVINVAQREADTEVCERFVEMMNGRQIPARITEISSFHTMHHSG